MGTWISHLRITEKLLQHLDGLDEEAFLFGNLAPDSGKPNEDWTQFDPPKEVTHYLKRGEGEGQIRDLQFYRDYLLNLRSEDKQRRYSFLLGYFFHLIGDSLWAKWIGTATKREFKSLIEGEGIKAWEVIKEDWYGLDQIFVRDHPQHIFWRVFMPAANPPSYLPFLSKEALHHQLDYIRRFYSEPDPGWVLDRPFPYLNESIMTRYVGESTSVILKIYGRFEQLANENDSHTALAHLPIENLQPYDSPLGDEII